MTSTSSYSDAPVRQQRPPVQPGSGFFDDSSQWEKIPRQMPEASGDEVHLHGTFPTQRQVRIIVSQRALVRIDAHAHSDLMREVGGALLGRVVRYQAQTFVEVLDAVLADSADHGPVHFTFTADTWAAINKAREREYQDLEIVGWFHTHPDLGVFYSSDDVVVHTAAFTLPWQVGLVIDPIRQEACFFGWERMAQGAGIQPIAGFYEWLDEHQEPIVDWEIRQQQHFSQPYGTEQQVALATGPWQSLPPISPWWGVLLGGTSLLLSLVLLLERFWPAG